MYFKKYMLTLYGQDRIYHLTVEVDKFKGENVAREFEEKLEAKFVQIQKTENFYVEDEWSYFKNIILEIAVGKIQKLSEGGRWRG